MECMITLVVVLFPSHHKVPAGHVNKNKVQTEVVTVHAHIDITHARHNTFCGTEGDGS